MSVSNYYRMLKENRFQVHPLRYPMMGLVGGCSVANSVLNRCQRLQFEDRIADATLSAPPIFIIGHWRSGTTLMHELMSLDPASAYPSTFEAFAPRHFLFSRPFFFPLVNRLLPKKRPMDSMTISAQSPQEDDFALISAGAATPYRRIAFPNRAEKHCQQLRFDNADQDQQQSVQRALNHFLKSLTIQYPDKRLVLKSPPHTGRIAQLAQWFPDAKFIHMARHPHKLVSSTMRLWKSLDETQSFQLPKYDDRWLKEYVFDCQRLMYESYFAFRDQMPTERLVEVKFEDLIASPEDTVAQIYDQLKLEDADAMKRQVRQYFDQRKGHKTNPMNLDGTLKTEIDQHWQPYAQAFGYTS